MQEFIRTCASLGLFPALTDGVPEAQRAVSEPFRHGANQIKIMVGGGVASPTDPIDGTQYALEEITAAYEEATAANTYVMAQPYSPRAITRAVQCGVRSIEHADMVVVEGDPTLYVLRMGEPEKNFVGVMQAGVWEKRLQALGNPDT